MDSNENTPSTSATKEKLSLRKRLLIKKSTKVGCSIAPDSPEKAATENDSSKTPKNLFTPKRLLDNGERSCLSDSEANCVSNMTSSLKMSSSNSAFLASSQCVNKSSRPKSMIENHTIVLSPGSSCSEKYLNKSIENRRTSPINRPIDILRRPSSILKTQSDPNCDASPYNSKESSPCNRAFGNGDNVINGIQKGRISSSLCEMQNSSDDPAMSDYEFIDAPQSSNNSDRNLSSRNSEEIKSKETNASNNDQGSGSMDSLARNSLFAAQVLRLIPTQKAKERNFLHGRLASNSLLGVGELEAVFPNREVEIFVGTWNMNGHMPPSELNDFLFPNAIKHVPDILAIGTQESISERTEWEICIQEALGPSHLLFHSTTLGTLHLSIFLRRDLIWFCSLPEEASISVRPGTAFRTKGAVAISFALFGTTFLFVTAHLTAHQEKVKERVHDIKRIIRALDLPKNLPLKHKNKDVTCNFDVVYWCGDLNFRLTEDRASVLRGLADSARKSLGSANSQVTLPMASPSLLRADQLGAVLAAGTILRGFREAPIQFAPTYKYDPGTQRFDTSSKQRAPAYTDRILFKTKTQATSTSLPGLRRTSSLPVSENASTVKCLAYDSVPSICSSDHKPVWALFTASLRPGTDIIPLAAGLFNREVYLEGIKRRAAMLDHPPDSIQATFAMFSNTSHDNMV